MNNEIVSPHRMRQLDKISLYHSHILLLFTYIQFSKSYKIIFPSYNIVFSFSDLFQLSF